MADQFVQEIPASPHVDFKFRNTQRFAVYRLVRTMIAAGWTVVESSTGSGFAGTYTADNWTDFVALNANNSWIVLQANSGQQVLIRFSTTGLWDEGWILWFPNGGYVAGVNQTDVRPSDTPALHLQVRGTHTSPGTYTSDGPLLGASVNTVFREHVIMCRDATGVGDESFYIFAPHYNDDLGVSTNGRHGVLAFESLVHETGLGIVDPYPYAWLCPTNLTSTWVEGLDDARFVLNEDDSGGIQGRWRRIWNAGQGGEVQKQYGGGHLYAGDASAIDATTGDNPAWESSLARPVYQVGGDPLIFRVQLTKKLEVAFKDPEGGWTQNIFFIEETETLFAGDYRRTFGAGAYARIGPWVVVRWSGNPADVPPR
jgi:hypothetical protein